MGIVVFINLVKELLGEVPTGVSVPYGDCSLYKVLSITQFIVFVKVSVPYGDCSLYKCIGTIIPFSP